MPIVKLVSDALSSDAARLVLATILVGGIVAAVLLGKIIPDALWTLAGAAVGFYFGGQGKA